MRVLQWRVVVGMIASIGIAAGVATAPAADWTEPVAVLHEFRPCISYRARLDGEFVVVQVKPEPGWHTFVMDNKERSVEKLAGRQSLGVDGPTEIALSDGLQVVGPWYQSAPKDFSKPELRWYSWGYEQEAQFVAKVRRSGPGPAQIGIRGQTCTATTCKNIDVTIWLPLSEESGTASEVDLTKLIAVRAAK
jgi:DsbC/DsbD-like thiol-disulfide interchange protein